MATQSSTKAIDVPFAGVKLHLKDANGKVVQEPVKTNSSGIFTFVGVQPAPTVNESPLTDTNRDKVADMIAGHGARYRRRNGHHCQRYRSVLPLRTPTRRCSATMSSVRSTA